MRKLTRSLPRSRDWVISGGLIIGIAKTKEAARHPGDLNVGKALPTDLSIAFLAYCTEYSVLESGSLNSSLYS
jgi:hypothetical protein